MKNMLKLNLMVMLALPALALANPNDELPIGRFELNIGARPSAPYPAMRNYNTNLTEQGSGSAYPTAVSRHHIIPFNVLRSFYNRVADNNRLSNIGGFLITYSNNLRFYAGGNGMDCGRLGNDLIDAGNLALAQRYSLARPGGHAMPLGFDTFEQFYTWLPGNLFIGPNERSDDPGEGFESNAHAVVGTEYFNTLSRAYGNMIRYINGDDSSSVLNAISHDLTVVARRRSVFALNPSNWIYRNGRYQLGGGGYAANPGSSSDATCAAMPPNLLGKIISIL